MKRSNARRLLRLLPFVILILITAAAAAALSRIGLEAKLGIDTSAELASPLLARLFHVPKMKEHKCL